MVGSPFHGIFSALQGGEAREIVREEDAVAIPAPMETAPQAGRLAVDIYEQDDYYIIRAPIAGVQLSDIDIEVTDNVVTIRGQRRVPDQLPDSQYYLQECYFGPFSRKVTLPCEVDPRRIRATFNKFCILKILIPKEDRVKVVRVTEG